MKKLVDQAIEAIARARAPKEPPVPAGPQVGSSGVLERPRCPVCLNTRARPVVAGRDTWIRDGAAVPGAPSKFLVVRCEICGHRYTTPRFVVAEKARAFEGEYPFYTRARQARAGRAFDEASRAAARAPFMRRVQALTRLAPRPGRALDLGCGDGFFLDALRDRGWDGVGVDVSEDVVWHARDVLGLDARALDVEQADLPEGPFDAVTLWGLLQLIYAPRALLDRVRAVLEPGGLLAVGVSNIDSLGAHLFRGRWRGLGLPRHLSHFTPDTLQRLLVHAGFEVVEVRYETPKWVVAGSVDDALPAPRPVRRVAKAGLYAAGWALGRTRYADTMEVYARATGRTPGA